MKTFGTLHLGLIAAIALLSGLLAWFCRRQPGIGRTVRFAIGGGLVVNELIWWVFRYSHEGLRFPHNLPLQLCDVSLWLTAIACLLLWEPAVEFAYFGGLAGAGMALLTPDLWSPWPTYPAMYFFLAHGGIVAGAVVLVWGGIVRLRRGCVWRAFRVLALFAAFVGTFNAIFGSNYMYLCRKPASGSLLDALGPWPVYVAGGAAVAVLMFWVLWVPVRLSFAGRAN